MKVFYLTVAISFLFSCSKAQDAPEIQKPEAVVTVQNYQLVWSDEFDVDGVPDITKWSFETGFIRNEELQYYTDNSKNARVENGILILEAIKEKYKNPLFRNKDDSNWKYNRKKASYTAASIETRNKDSWQYGKFEVKAKLPKGKGQWPAIWMLGNNKTNVSWPECGEIDIMEHVGHDPKNIHGTVHTAAFNHVLNTQVDKTVEISNPYTEFHVYGVVWTPEIIEFYLDGKKYHEFKNQYKTEAEWPFDQEFYLKLNVAIGGAWGGQQGIDDSVFPQRMEVDWVRIYQKK